MIKEASEKDKSAIYNLWQSSFSIKNSEMINCFFNYGMNEGKVILCEKDEKLVASVFMHDMNIMFHNRLLKSVFLSHVAVHPDYRKTSSLDECLKNVIDECEKKALFTFVEATSYKFWENYGFQEGTLHRYYELNERHFENVSQNTSSGIGNSATGGEDDEAYNEVVEFAIQTGKISASLIQRRFRFGYNRAARMMDLLEARGIVGPQNGSKPREVLVKLEKNDVE